MSWEAIAVLVTLVLTLALLLLERAPPAQLMLGAMVLLWNMGIISTEDALRGFANEGLMTVGAFFVVGHAVNRSRMLARVAHRILGRNTSERCAILRLCTATMLLSSFLSNTPLVALMIPIIRDWARQRGLAPSKFLIPLSYASIIGGMTTTIGTSTNLLLNGLLMHAGEQPFGFFEPGKAALPVALLSLVFLSVAGPKLLPAEKGGLLRHVRRQGDDLIASVELTAVSRLVGRTVPCVLAHLGLQPASLLKIRRPAPACSAATDVGLAEEGCVAAVEGEEGGRVLAPIGANFQQADFLLVTRVAEMPRPVRWLDFLPPLLFVAGLALTIFGVVLMVRVALSLSAVFMLGGWVRARDLREAVDWHLLILIGSALGLATAMQKSGLSQSMAQLLLGSGVPKALVPAALYLMVMVTTEVITNNAAAALGVPLAISLAEAMGLTSPKPLVMVVMLASSTCFALPLGYATNLMVKGPGGYTFCDFLRIGIPVDLLWLVGVTLWVPYVLPLE